MRGARMNRDLQSIAGSRYVDVQEASLFLRVSIACIRKWLSTGKLTRYHAGRRVLIKITDLEALVVADTPAEGDAA
jgi:excisionase family DNA binding protein